MIREETLTTYHTVTLGALTREGTTLVAITEQSEEGEQYTRTLHVPAGLPGERVTIAVESPAQPPKRRKRYWKARPPRVWITEIHEASPLRIEASCPVFGECGGCQLQHMSYDRVLPLESCPIAHEQINHALKVLSAVPNQRPQVLIRCGAATGQMLIQPHPDPNITQQLAGKGLDLHAETMEEMLCGELFRIRPSSFFQTNTAQAEKMATMVLDGLAVSAQHSHEHRRTIVDAYCGVGTFALLLARQVDNVIAIEESASAIKDAQWNLREVSNVEILKGKVEELLPTLECHIDGLVIDPPRAGCQQIVLDVLVQHPVDRIVYVSCEPSTLARDLNILCHLHPMYRLLSVQPLDMFPQTAHIECIATLEHI